MHPQAFVLVHSHLRKPRQRLASLRSSGPRFRFPVCNFEAAFPRIVISSSPQHSHAPVRNAHIVVLTDFAANPVLAVRDRASDPLSACMLVFAALLGWVASRIPGRVKEGGFVDTSDIVAARQSQSNGVQYTDDEYMQVPANSRTTSGENAIWLNMSLRTLWRLFRKSTNSLTKEVLQPVLDQMEFPPGVKSVKITNLTLGESPALVRKIQRLPSRSLSEIQYKYAMRLVGDKEGRIDIDVVVNIPAINKDVVVPISVSSLDIDANVWLGFTVVPYQPWVRFAQWALFNMPNVKLDIKVGNFLPVTAIPILSKLLRKILTRDVPREFLFPKTQVIDFMGEHDTNVILEQDLLEARGVPKKLTEASLEELRANFPSLSGLFDSLDIDNDGTLDKMELSNGLIEWGYASEADRNSIGNLLDVNNDGYVSLREFIQVWDDLQNVFVPRKFRGVVSGVLLEAEGMRTPLLGMSNPYVVLHVESQSCTSKRDNDTSIKGNEKGTAVWNEGWELFVQQPRTAMLRVEIREGCYFAYYRDYIPPPPEITSSHSGTVQRVDAVKNANRIDTIIGYGNIPVTNLKGPAQGVWVDLTTGGGRVRIDVQFSEFVDPQIL